MWRYTFNTSRHRHIPCTCMQVHRQHKQTYMSVYIDAHTCVHMTIYMYTHVCTHLYTCTHVCTCLYTCTHVCAHLYTCTHMCIHIQAHVHNTHTQNESLNGIPDRYEGARCITSTPWRLRQKGCEFETSQGLALQNQVSLSCDPVGHHSMLGSP